MTDKFKIIGEFFKNLREKHNLKKTQLAKMLGISHQAVKKWETGETLPNAHNMIEIWEKLGCEPNDIIKLLQTIERDERLKNMLRQDRNKEAQ